MYVKFINITYGNSPEVYTVITFEENYINYRILF